MVHNTLLHVFATLLLNLIKIALLRHFPSTVIYVPYVKNCLVPAWVPAPFGSLQGNLDGGKGEDFDVLIDWEVRTARWYECDLILSSCDSILP
jgi:hypothetical protein